MKWFVSRLLVNAAALGVVVWLFPGVTLRGNSLTDKVVTLVIVALIFGVLNAVVGGVVKFLATPFIILSLGLMILVINAAMLLLTSYVAGQVGLRFHVAGFWTAVWGALVFSVTAMVLNAILKDRD
jgi:putative membrane protein